MKIMIAVRARNVEGNNKVPFPRIVKDIELIELFIFMH